ncbi:MAG: succinylglutamate desuccinylase/aspartoacylase family protein [Bacteroidales bacterium]|jgi:hypothetical protein|nr:succinylglutamate desuccinylase/aspartoacylase family protein [Bacteroidales bacterium]
MLKMHLSRILIIVTVSVAAIISGMEFREMHAHDTLYPCESLTQVKMLSDYFEGLNGTRGDTEVYLFDSGVSGGTVLVMGGAHANEAAAYLTPVVILENIMVTQGRVLVIPQMNKSGFTCSDPMEGFPTSYQIETPEGMRSFRLGSRVTNPLHQWPDPLVYAQYPSNQKLSGFETRNLNRAFPGRPDGTLTERIAYSIVQLIEKENVNIVVDIHESSPEVPIVDVIVYHEKYEDMAMIAVLNLEMEDLQYSPELSPKNFRGLSHRELGDRTNAVPYLMETSNPSMGRLRGRTDTELVIKGLSENYKKAKESGALRIAYREERGEPISHRVGRHVTGFLELVNSYNMFHPDSMILIEGLPSYSELMERGVGYYLTIKSEKNE